MRSFVSVLLAVSLVLVYIPMVFYTTTKNINNKITYIDTKSRDLSFNTDYYVDLARPNITKREIQIETQRLEELRQKQEEEKLRQIEQQTVKYIQQIKKKTETYVPKPPVVNNTSYAEAVNQWCGVYGCNPSQLLRVMSCESGGRANAYNSRSGATGVFQFMSRTFYANATKVGIASPNIWDPYQQIQVATWMFSIGQARQWSCK